MFAFIAFICFLLAVLGVNFGPLTVAKLVYLGLMFVALALLVPANWPLTLLTARTTTRKE